MAVWPLLLILLCNLLNVSWWLIATAFGYTVCMVANTSTARYAEFSINAARGMDLSAVPAKFKGIIGLDMYAKWGPSMLFLVAVVWAAAVPLSRGRPLSTVLSHYRGDQHCAVLPDQELLFRKQ
jgi:hypothetical protein